jgi:hypothetical protein
MYQEIVISHCIHENEIQTIVTEDCYQLLPIKFKYNEIFKYQVIVISHCIHENEIQTIITEDCYQLVPIQFKYNEIFKLAFLDGNRFSNNAIIKSFKYNLKKIYLEDSKRLLEIV